MELEGRQLAYQIGMPQGESRMEDSDDGRFRKAKKREFDVATEIGNLYMQCIYIYIYMCIYIDISLYIYIYYTYIY